MFINLWVHSYYSLLKSSLSIDDIITYALKHHQKYVSLVDVNNMYGAMEFYNKAKAHNLKPIIGLQINYQNENVVLLAKNNHGYHNLIKISSLALTNKIFNLNDYLRGVCVIVNNSQNSKWLNAKQDVYSAISGSDDEIAVRECFFENCGEERYLKAVMAIGSDQQISDFDNVHQFDNAYMISEKQSQEIFTPRALKNLDKLINECDWVIDKPSINFVRYDLKTPSNILLQAKCCEGLQHRLNSTHAPVEYIDRLKKELSIINQMNFNDYFLVVHDYVNFAKRSGILVGPGRGSAAGSLVSWVLGITNIDPIANNLIFERFLNPARITMPDIDIDFMDNRRNEIIEYIFNKYGVDRVAHIITFQRIKAKMAIRDVGRILGIDLPIVNMISKLITPEYDTDLSSAIEHDNNISSYAKKYEELFDIAEKIINFPRQVGMHAAGIVISNNPLSDLIPIQASVDGINCTQYSMEYLEPLGLIKMDILGLVNLTTINDTLGLIKKTKSLNVDLSQIPLDDKKVFHQLSIGDTLGIFQLESPGMKNLIVKIKPSSIEDISITSALFRPGPQKNIPQYLENKANKDKIVYLNDDIKSILASTYNIIIYQEQIIQIVQKIANFSLGEADLFRRAISKKNAEKLSQLESQFIDGGLKNHYQEKELRQIFDYINEFANYGFNHSHSLAYSYISYWMAYLKVHYPLEYFTVLLSTSENSVDKIALYAQGAKALGINVLAPSINISTSNFTIHNNCIVFGLNAIKGIGNETINKIIEARNQIQRKFKNYLEAIGTLANSGIGIKTMEIIVKSGAFDELLENKSRNFLLMNLEELYNKASTMTTSGEMLIHPILKNDVINDEIQKQLNDEQYKLLGVSFVEHPIIKIKKNYSGEDKLINLIDIDTFGRALVTLISHRVIKTKTNASMAFIKIEDETKAMDVAVFPGVYEKIKNILFNKNVYIITIKNNERGYQALNLKEYKYE